MSRPRSVWRQPSPEASWPRYWADTPAPADTPAAGETAQSDSAGDIADDLTEPLADRLGATLRETLASLFPPVWRDPGSVAATAGLGATASLTQELHAPMAWAWRWMLTVPDSIQPDPGSAMDRAFAGVPGGAVLKDFFVPSKANQALRAMWERTRDLALNARTPLISLVVAIFVGFALYKVFMGAPVGSARLRRTDGGGGGICPGELRHR